MRFFSGYTSAAAIAWSSLYYHSTTSHNFLLFYSFVGGTCWSGSLVPSIVVNHDSWYIVTVTSCMHVKHRGPGVYVACNTIPSLAGMGRFRTERTLCAARFLAWKACATFSPRYFSFFLHFLSIFVFFSSFSSSWISWSQIYKSYDEKLLWYIVT